MYLSGPSRFSSSVTRRQPAPRRAHYIPPSRFIHDSPLGVLPAVIPLGLKAVKLVAAVVPLIKHGTAQPAFAAVQGANVPGRALDINALNMGTYYLYSMESHGLYKLNRTFGKKKGFEDFLVKFTEKIGDAARAGQLSNADDAEAVYNKVIVPWLGPILGAIEPSWKKLFVAYVDRYLYGQTFGGIDARIKKLADVMAQANAAASTVPTVSTVTPVATSAAPIPADTSPVQVTPQSIWPASLSLTAPAESSETGTVLPKVTQASIFGGAPGWLIPTLIGAGVFLLTQGRRKFR